jgi:insertion element IS1 protein InsB
MQSEKSVENGTTKNENYTYIAYKSNGDKNIIQLTKEGFGVRSISRILKVSTTTLFIRIIEI